MAARVTLRQLAIDDVDDAFDYLLEETPPGTAADFVDEFQQALDHLRRHPLTGSLQFAFELDLPELQSWPLKRFPYLVSTCVTTIVTTSGGYFTHIATSPPLSEMSDQIRTATVGKHTGKIGR